MNLSSLFHRTLRGLDVLLVAGIVLTSVLAWYGIRIVEFAALPLLLWVFRRHDIRITKRDWAMLALMGQFFLLMAINSVLYQPRPEVPVQAVTKAVTLWVGAIAVLGLMLLRVFQVHDPARLWRTLGPLALLISIGAMGWEQFTNEDAERCRVTFYAKGTLLPPLWFTMFAVASFNGWMHMTRFERVLRYGLVALTVMATVGFSGARAMLLVEFVTFPLLALVVARGALVRTQVRNLAAMGAALAAGFAVGLLLDARFECGFGARLVAAGEMVWQTAIEEQDANRTETASIPSEPDAVPKPEAEAAPPANVPRMAEPSRRTAPPAPSLEERMPLEQLVASASQRPEMWVDALELIRGAPLRGYGFVNEPILSGEFPNFHQQYLSWLIWGGPLILLSGVAMVVSPFFVFRVRKAPDNLVLALALVMPVALDSFSVTLFYRDLTLAGYVFAYLLFYALSRDQTLAREADASGGRDRGERGLVEADV